MNSERKYSTKDVPIRKFIPHGKVEFTVGGNILRGEATGPFNLEFISALHETEFKFVQELSQGGKWVELIEIKLNVLATTETLSAFQKYLLLLVEKNVAPTATAYVITPDVEGVDVMTPLIAKCYAIANLRFRAFEHLQDANIWLAEQLEAVGEHGSERST